MDKPRRFDEQVKPVKTEHEKLPSDIIEKVETLGPNIIKQIDDLLAQPASNGKRNLEMVVSIKVPNFDNFNRVFRECIAKIK